jgi:hypothetical protein
MTKDTKLRVGQVWRRPGQPGVWEVVCADIERDGEWVLAHKGTDAELNLTDAQLREQDWQFVGSATEDPEDRIQDLQKQLFTREHELKGDVLKFLEARRAYWGDAAAATQAPDSERGMRDALRHEVSQLYVTLCDLWKLPRPEWW